MLTLSLLPWLSLVAGRGVFHQQAMHEDIPTADFAKEDPLGTGTPLFSTRNQIAGEFKEQRRLSRTRRTKYKQRTTHLLKHGDHRCASRKVIGWMAQLLNERIQHKSTASGRVSNPSSMRTASASEFLRRPSIQMIFTF